MRPSWDEFFLNIAKEVSTRATCLRAKHGCVLVKDKTIISSGYNGSPPGIPHCTEDGCFMISGHCERCNHAEVNAVCQAAINGVSVKGATSYTTGASCLECIRTLLCAKIERIVYIKGGHYAFPEEEEKLRKIFIENSGVDIVPYEPLKNK